MTIAARGSHHSEQDDGRGSERVGGIDAILSGAKAVRSGSPKSQRKSVNYSVADQLLLSI